MRRIVIMGVSGCGKTSVGQALAARLGAAFVDADDLHPPANVEKMRAGVPLTDADRAPWLDRVAARLQADAPVVVACSALRRAYRDRLRAGAGGPVTFIHLSGDRTLIAARMAARKGHYMPPALLDSQFATLEPPTAEEALTMGIEEDPDRIAAAILSALQ
ncbi:gluconokinase [Rhodobacteraceae bacterium HSP-20]|uniref:Gluconokinase n=1 Tax=Paragemmobacter amnigenus TaxID=2852097 RepID=A0ABS6J4F3_9RHOB|nr:gluconokinase [Rhodobacter amnigenus]MBU9698633.1 gluconokinase [Rhodobacter amnigenus]MBV4389860.1 gluconokinase [Rhodobacter amnigenus]